MCWYERNANLSHIKVAHGFFMLYIVILLPESLTPAQMRIAQEKHARQQSLREQAAGSQSRGYVYAVTSWNPLRPLTILFPTGPGSSPRLRANLILLATCDTLFFSVGMGGMTVSIMYAEMIFKWGNYEVRLSEVWVTLGNVSNHQCGPVLHLSLIRQFCPGGHAFCNYALSGQSELEVERQGNQYATSSPEC